MQYTGKAARRGYDKKIIYIKKEKRREKLWYVNIVELRTRTVLHSARDVERNLEAPVQPEAMAPEEIILTAETQQALMEAPEVMQEITEDSREAITIRTVISTDHSYRTPLLSRKNISQFPCGDILDMNFCFLSRW